MKPLLLLIVTPERLELSARWLRVSCSTNWATESKMDGKCITIQQLDNMMISWWGDGVMWRYADVTIGGKLANGMISWLADGKMCRCADRRLADGEMGGCGASSYAILTSYSLRYAIT